MKYLKLISLMAIITFAFSSIHAQASYKISARANGGLLDTLGGAGGGADTAIYLLPRNITSIGQLSWEYQVVDTTLGTGVTGTYLIQTRINSSAAWAPLSNGNLPTTKVSPGTGTAAGVLLVTVTNTAGYQYRLVAINSGAGKAHSNRVFAYWLPVPLPLSND